jgi:hypothetical protein
MKAWIEKNYKSVSKYSNDGAKTIILNKFPAITESSIEMIIALAAQLQKGDQAKSLALLQQRLEMLQHEKAELLKRISEKEAIMSKTDDEKMTRRKKRR